MVVDDDPSLAGSLTRLLRELGYDVETADSFEGALLLAAERTPDHALLDVRIKGGNGIALIQRLRALNPAMNVILFTAYPSIASAVQAVRLGADDYLPKPVHAEQIRAVFAAGRRPPVPAPTGDGTKLDDAPEPPDLPDLPDLDQLDDLEVPGPEEDGVYSLARARWEHINFVLRDCGWNIAAAARRLNVHRQSLQRMLKKHPPKR